MTQRTPVQTLLALALAMSGCAAQANEDYKGEPLLRLTGRASVNALTHGQLIKPALCFKASHVAYGHVERDELPAPVADLFSANWSWPAGSITIAEVDSRGQFPADFNVSVYLPPPQSAVQPLFHGEPPSALGSVCAVRAEHPEVVFPPLESEQDCGDSDEPCVKLGLWATRESQRYFKQEYDCPNKRSAKNECVFHTAGDELVAEEDFEYVIGQDQRRVLYLAEPAPAGSYTAWQNGVEGALSQGYHLFEVEQDYYSEDLDCRLRADVRASTDAGEKLKAYLIYDPATGASHYSKEHAAEYDEEHHRLLAQYQMESCARPHIHEVSQDEPLAIVINPNRSHIIGADILFSLPH